MKKASLLMGFLACGLQAVCCAESEMVFEKPTLRWLWGGFGFHNSEATMTGIMTDEFRDERAVKTFLEISPTYSRVYAGFHDWTKEAMDRFADYYDATFRKAGTTLYLVPGRMPAITADFNPGQYAEEVASRLTYLVKDRKCSKVRYYCLSNELSVGPTYAWFASHFDLYKTCCETMFRAFRRHGLDIGLMTTDSSGIERMKDIDWAITNLNEVTDSYCWHFYNSNLKPGDLSLYSQCFDACSSLVAKALAKEKRLSIGEYGFQGKAVPYATRKMCDDRNYSHRYPQEANLAAISRAEMGLAAMNAGCLNAVTWTMIDYPDPFLREDGDTPREKAVYDVARFSGFGLDIRYNKNGLFRWCAEEKDYSSYSDLYTMGYLMKLFRKGGRVLPWHSSDATLRGGGITNPDGSASFTVINWGEKKNVKIVCAHRMAKPMRVYLYDSAHVPYNIGNDLQGESGRVTQADDGSIRVTVPAKSMVFLTSDYLDRTPSAIRRIQICGDRLSWAPCQEPEHVYYRIFKDGRQIASTVATSYKLKEGEKGIFQILSVDRWGNAGRLL